VRYFKRSAAQEACWLTEQIHNGTLEIRSLVLTGPLDVRKLKIVIRDDRIQVEISDGLFLDADRFEVCYPPLPPLPSDVAAMIASSGTSKVLPANDPPVEETTSPEVLTYNFLVEAGEKLRGRKKFYQSECKRLYGAGSHVFDIQWRNACKAVGVPVHTRTKRKRGKVPPKRRPKKRHSPR
jgi:hypothetical protein